MPDGGPSLPLPGPLRRLYGGDLGLASTTLYANFVQSIDGVVAISQVQSSGSVLSGKNPADRFVMGLLRASADAVLVGAGTLRDTPNHHWTAEHILPELSAEWVAYRRALGIAPQPRLILVTGSGAVDVMHPAIRAGATFLTTAAGADRIAEIVPSTCDVRTFPGDEVPLGEAVAWLRAEGHQRILSEAGPRVTGQLLSDDLLDELFVTISPVLAGRDGPRPGLVEGVELLPLRRLTGRLASARTGGDFLLLRYSLTA